MSRSSWSGGRGRFTADTRTSSSDRRFLEDLHDFIEREKKHLRCPEEGADELRYTVHRSAFNQVLRSAPGKPQPYPHTRIETIKFCKKYLLNSK